MNISAMTPEQQAALKTFISNPDGQEQYVLDLTGAFLVLWCDCLNELIDESDARNVSHFSNEIRRIAQEYGFELDSSNYVTPNFDGKVELKS